MSGSADEIDVRREANRAAERLMHVSGAPSKVVRTMARSAILDQYRIAVEYEDMPPGMDKAWLEGWRKGFGIRTRNPLGNIQPITSMTRLMRSSGRHWMRGRLRQGTKAPTKSEMQERMYALLRDFGIYRGEYSDSAESLLLQEFSKGVREVVMEDHPSIGTTDNPDKWLPVKAVRIRNVGRKRVVDLFTNPGPKTVKHFGIRDKHGTKQAGGFFSVSEARQYLERLRRKYPLEASNSRYRVTQEFGSAFGGEGFKYIK